MLKSKLISLTLLSAALCSCGQSSKFKMPEPLQPGDTIAIISPASSPNPAHVDSACRVLKKWGYVPVVGKHAITRHGTFAGTIEQRLEDLKRAYETPGIKAIICGRGGYGSIQLLCELPENYFSKYPKWLVGFSDITALHGAHLRNGIMSVHANMCYNLGVHHGEDIYSKMLHDILRGNFPSYKIAANKYNHHGVATGTLIGGNLAVLNDIAASPYDMLSIDNAILFLEDVGENLEALNRAFYSLKASGVFDRIKGLIVCNFKGADPNPDFETPNDMIHSIVKGYDFPVCYDFPVGHINEHQPVVEGAEVTLTVNDDGATLIYTRNDK